MTLHRRDLTEIPADIAAVGQRILPASDRYRVIGDHLADLLDDAQFTDLYEPTGRAALSPSLLALVTLFQFVEDLPDREAAAQVVVRVDWKSALHLPLDYAGFDYSCLCYFRQRLLAHAQERLVFDTLLGKIQALGFIKKRGKHRTDSLAVLGAVRQLSALETVGETLRLAVRALLERAAAWTAQAVPASFQEQYLHLRPDYRLTTAEQAALFLQVGQDGYWLLDRLAAAPAGVRDLAPLKVLQTVWTQRYERADGPVRVREHGAACTERIVTPPDPGVRAGEKRGKQWQGDKVHVTETAEPAGPTFLTDVTTAPAPSGDVTALPRIRAQLAAIDLLPAEQYVDSGYISGTQLAQSQAAGIEVVLVGPPLEDTSPNQFKIADFAIDRDACQAICPAGHCAVKWRGRTDRDGSRAVTIPCAAAPCATCPLRAQCPTSRSGRSLHLSEHDELLVARRAVARTDAFRARMRARPAIEATLSALVRGHGLRRHRYRGEAKRCFEHLLKGAACNLKRLVRALVARWTQAGAPALPAPRALPAGPAVGP